MERFQNSVSAISPEQAPLVHLEAVADFNVIFFSQICKQEFSAIISDSATTFIVALTKFGKPSRSTSLKKEPNCIIVPLGIPIKSIDTTLF